MYEIDELYEYLMQKRKDFDSLVSSVDNKLRELESKSSRVSTLLSFHFLLRIRFGKRYKKLDERLTNTEPIYEELVHKQRFMKPILQATDPTLEDILRTKSRFEEWYQEAKSLMDLLDDIERELDKLNDRIQKTRFKEWVRLRSNRVWKWCIRFFCYKINNVIFPTCFFRNNQYIKVNKNQISFIFQ